MKRAIVLNGVQLAGKSTQIERLVEKGFFSVVASDVLRRAAANDQSYAQTIALCQSSGILVPDRVTISAILKEIRTASLGSRYVVLDGCMRTSQQAKDVSNCLRDEGYSVTVCLLHLEEDVVLERVQARGRDDDKNPEVLTSRLSAYFNNLGPVLSTLVMAGHSIHSIDANRPVDEIHNQVCEIAGL